MGDHLYSSDGITCKDALAHARDIEANQHLGWMAKRRSSGGIFDLAAIAPEGHMERSGPRLGKMARRAPRGALRGGVEPSDLRWRDN